MTLSLDAGDIIALFVAVLSLIAAILSAAAWVVGRIDKLREELKHFVTEATCQERRANCPCLVQLNGRSNANDTRRLAD